MKNLKIQTLIATVLGVALFASVPVSKSHADNVEDYFLRNAMQRYFPTQVTARSLGMGGVFAALHGDTLSVVGNPAGLGYLEQYELSFSYQFEQNSGNEPAFLSSVDEDIHRGLILGAAPINDQIKIGLGVVPSFSDVGDPNDTDTEQYQVPFGIAYRCNDQFSVGYGLSYIDDSVDSNVFNGDSDSAFLHRLGIVFSPYDRVDYGIVGYYGHGDAASSSVTGAAFDGNRETWGIRGGFAWYMRDDLTFAADIGYEQMNTDGVTALTTLPGVPRIGFGEDIDVLSVAGGLEYDCTDKLQARTGVGYTNVDYDTSDPSLSLLVNGQDWVHWSGGLSYQITERIGVDTGVQVRFIDDIDFLAGVTASVKF